jgi:two-component system nitrate/nitrite response regulator NarL
MAAPASPRPIRIMMVDRHKLVREGVRMLVSRNPVFQVVAEAENGDEALLLAEREQPDVILLALDLGPQTGLDVLPGLLTKSRSSRVLVLTHVEDPEAHRKAMVLGAMGVLQKDVGVEVLFKAIEKVHAGEIWYDRSKMGSVLRDMLQNGNGKKPDPLAVKIASLTPRENEVIALVSEGLKNKVIGEKLFISETTVRHHLTSVFEKLEVSNRLELILFAFSQGLLSVPGKDYHKSSGRVNSGSEKRLEMD